MVLFVKGFLRRPPVSAIHVIIENHKKRDSANLMSFMIGRTKMPADYPSCNPRDGEIRHTIQKNAQ